MREIRDAGKVAGNRKDPGAAGAMQSVRHLARDSFEPRRQHGEVAVDLHAVGIDDRAGELTRELSIPTIGIGAGPNCDGQVLVLHDVLGMYPHSPSFAKRYAEVGAVTVGALRAFADDIRSRTFPES